MLEVKIFVPEALHGSIGYGPRWQALGLLLTPISVGDHAGTCGLSPQPSLNSYTVTDQNLSLVRIAAKKVPLRADNMAQSVKVLAAKAENLSSIPGTHMWKDRTCSHKLSP